MLIDFLGYIEMALAGSLGAYLFFFLFMGHCMIGSLTGVVAY